jgi:hypothetical protein
MSAQMGRTLQATLYVRAGCHLCEQALADLERLRQRHPHEVRVVDINNDAELEARYGLRIPVLRIGDREVAPPLPEDVLERELRHADAR